MVDQEADGLHETVEETPPQPSYPEDQQIQKEAEIQKEAQPPLQPAQARDDFPYLSFHMLLRCLLNSDFIRIARFTV